MASASAGLELPATSLIAPLLGRIAVSWQNPFARGALITRRRQGWQYDGTPGAGVVPLIHAVCGPGWQTRPAFLTLSTSSGGRRVRGQARWRGCAGHNRARYGAS